MQNVEILKEIGLSDKEALIYIESLQLGPASILAISKATKLHRPIIYKIVESMLDKGVMKTTLNKSRTEYVSVEPEELIKIIENKRRLLEQALPGLASLSTTGKDEVKIFFYHGKKQLQELFKTGLTSKTEILSFFPTKYMVELFGKREMEDIIKQRVEKGIFSKTLRSKESEQEFEGSTQEQQALREVKYIPENIPLRMGVVIFDDKVNLFSPIEENFGVQIKSKSYAELMRFFFNSVWETSK